MKGLQTEAGVEPAFSAFAGFAFSSSARLGRSTEALQTPAPVCSDFPTPDPGAKETSVVYDLPSLGILLEQQEAE